MFAVHRDNRRPGDFGGLGHQLPGCDQHFLVRQSHRLAGRDRLIGGFQANHTHCGRDHQIRAHAGGDSVQSFPAPKDLRLPGHTEGVQASPQGLHVLPGRDGHQLGLKPGYLSG